MIQFDLHIFQMGWFNHQRVKMTTFLLDDEPHLYNFTMEKWLDITISIP